MAISPVASRATAVDGEDVDAIRDYCDAMNNTLDWQYSDVHQIMLDIYGGDPSSPRSGPTMHEILLSMLQKMPSTGPDNPWWSTNSYFVNKYNQLAAVYPKDPDNSSSRYSFPEFLSLWGIRLTQQSTEPPTMASVQRDWFDEWGVRKFNRYTSTDMRRQLGYTWFDWISDAFKSNLVLTSTPGTNALLAAVERTGATEMVYGDTASTTNAAPVVTNQLEQLEINQLDIDDASSIVDDVVGAIPVETIIPTDYTGGDPHVRIFGGATYGSITVDPVDANFELPPTVRNALHAAARFLWRVLFLVAVWGIVRSEFDFWSTLGGSAT